jgi:hypothetical protein
VKDANGQALAYIYFEKEPRRRFRRELLTRDEAVAGPLAEAIASDRQFGDVFWKGYAAEGDWNGIVSDLKLSGTPAHEGFSVVNRMAVLAAM